MNQLPSKQRSQFIIATRDLREAAGSVKKKIYWNEILPAAYDRRFVLTQTFALMDSLEWDSALFKNERSWATPLSPESKGPRAAYLNAIHSIVQTLKPTPERIQIWAPRAKKIAAHSRLTAGEGMMPASPGDAFSLAHDGKILAALENPQFTESDLL